MSNRGMHEAPEDQDPLGLKSFDMSGERGFLPASDPKTSLPAEWAAWQEIGRELPKLLLAGRVGPAVDRLTCLSTESCRTEADRRAAMRVLSFIAHAYVWERGGARNALPAAIAVPWIELAEALGRPPVLSYASYALDNWRRIDPDGPLEAENVAIVQNFLGGADEDWFIAIHVEIEAIAAAALRAIGPAQTAVEHEDAPSVERHLDAIAEALEAMNTTLRRMPELCDPYIYFHRVRPFIHGWKDHPALPGGLLYRGAERADDRRLALRGETGAQSSIVPVLDALLGVPHAPDPLRSYLEEMQAYMPPGHRRFLATVGEGPDLRAFATRGSAEVAHVAERRDACLHWLEAFRSTHLEYAATYIHQQARTNASNPSDLGTGGTPFMSYLAKHRDETAHARRG